MTVPANLSAAFFGRSAGHAVVSIATPLNGSMIANNATAEAISGTASSIAGNITSVQYQIDGGAWQPITITPAATVNYFGGNAGQVGVGGHTITVKVTDAASNTAAVTSSYVIASGITPASYTWGPVHTPNGNNNYLTITNAARNAPVAYTINEYNGQNQIIGASATVSIGMTDSNGNFNFTGTAGWAAGGFYCNVGLLVGGQNVANFTFLSSALGAQVGYGPSLTPSGNVTLSIAGYQPQCTVAQTVTYSPSGRTAGPTAFGSTDSAGDFSTAYALSWGTDTSAQISVTVGGAGIGTFSFAP